MAGSVSHGTYLPFYLWGRWLDWCAMEHKLSHGTHLSFYLGTIVPWNIIVSWNTPFIPPLSWIGWGRWLWIHLFIHFVSRSTFQIVLLKLESGSEADGCSLEQSIQPVNFVVAAHYYHQTEQYTEADGGMTAACFTIHARALLYLCSRWRWHFNLQMDCNPRHLLIS